MNIKVKLKDVAIKAEVSVATVSRFINNVGYIRPETSEKIQKAINELNSRGGYLHLVGRFAFRAPKVDPKGDARMMQHIGPGKVATFCSP